MNWTTVQNRMKRLLFLVVDPNASERISPNVGPITSVSNNKSWSQPEANAPANRLVTRSRHLLHLIHALGSRNNGWDSMGIGEG